MANRTVLIGDARVLAKTIPDKSVHLIVTSPPYWTLKDYNHESQIGLNDSYPEYLSKMSEVWSECLRVLKPGCRICINIGDQFLRASENSGIYEIAPIHADIIHQILSLGEGEMIYLGAIIWRKITNTHTSGGGSLMGSIYFPRDGYLTYEHEYILLFKKKGVTRRPSKEDREKSKLTLEQRKTWFRGLWSIPPARQKGGHPARFPIELPERLIRMFTFYGETVLDPFAGSGTTLDAAEKTGRISIGIELNPLYAEQEQTTLDLFNSP